MSIELEEHQQRDRVPVVKRTRIGENFIGAVVRYDQRDVLKDGQPVLKSNGKPRQELVVTCVTMPNTTSPAGIGEHTAVPNPGDLVRLILRGGAFGSWIEARNSHRDGKLLVGDILIQQVTHAQVYDANGGLRGGQITDQASADAVPRGQTIGFYGPLALRVPGPEQQSWVTAAENAYRDATAITLDAPKDEPIGGTAHLDSQPPFTSGVNVDDLLA